MSVSASTGSKIMLILDLLQEESAEVISAVSKIRRFGDSEFHPSHPDQNNRQLLVQELGDITALVELLLENEYLTQAEIDKACAIKFGRLAKFAPEVIL